MIPTRSPAPLRDVLYDFSLAQSTPDAALLDDFIRCYPEYSEALIAFATELTTDALRDASISDVHDEQTVSPSVERAISRFHNKLFDVKKADTIANTRTFQDTASTPNPFAGLDRHTYRILAERLQVNSVFLGKLRDRQIDPHTIPERFCKMVAKELTVPLSLVVAHLGAPPARLSVQFYKADQKPDMGKRQTFEDAVRSSGLSDDQQSHLLTL